MVASALATGPDASEFEAFNAEVYSDLTTAESNSERGNASGQDTYLKLIWLNKLIIIKDICMI